MNGPKNTEQANTTACGRCEALEARVTLLEQVYAPTTIQIDRIARLVSEATKLSLNSIRSGQSTADLCDARAALNWVARRLTGKTTGEIARYLNNCDPSTIRHSLKRAEQKRKNNRDFGALTDHILWQASQGSVS
jgi:chromosomal replication initiation ATPase DnaA